jgi:hypothetical protein
MMHNNFILFVLLPSIGNAFSPLLVHDSRINPVHGLKNHGHVSHEFRLYDSVCDIPENVSVSNLVNRPGSANILRRAVVWSASGDCLALDSVMGKGTSVVVFLRHMG